MSCKQTLLELTAYAHGEASGLAGWRVRRHLAHCPGCAAQLADLKRLHIRLLAADIVPQSMAPAPAGFLPRTVERGSTRMILKLLCGTAATAGMTLALLTLPGSHHSRSMAAEIRQALEDVNTWHLRGWKLQNGKLVPWEVWARRAPFFYREQVGQDVVVDDGKRRVSLFAPLKSSGNPKAASPGVLLITPSLPDDQNVRWSYRQMVTLWQADIKPAAQAEEGPIFNFGQSGIFAGGEFGSFMDQLYTVDRHTWLPVRYEAQLGKGDHKRTIATLAADYNASLPADLMRLPTAAPGFQVYDTTQSVSVPPQENAVTQQGITLQATPLEVDDDGNILVRIKGWMGNLLMDRSAPMRLNVDVDRWADPGPVEKTPATFDDRQRAYISVRWDALQFGNLDPAGQLLLLSPAEPISQDDPMPTTLTISLSVALNMDTRFNGTLGIGDSQLSQHEFRLTVPLPAPSTANIEQGSYAYLDRNWRTRIAAADGIENLPAATDFGRAVFYGFKTDRRHPDRQRLQQEAKWYEQYLVHSSCRAAKRLFKPHIAQVYNLLGDKVRTRQLLKEAVEDTYNPFVQVAQPGMTAAQRQQRDAQNRENRQIEAVNHHNAEEALRRFDLGE